MRRPRPLLAALPVGAALALLLLLPVMNVAARPTIRRAFFNDYPSAVGSRLDNLPSHATHCGVCHYDFNGGGPKNPYGNAVAAAIPGYSTYEAAIKSIENVDQDGDGYPSLTEITNVINYVNTPTFPGLTPSNVSSTSNVPNQSEILGYLVPQTGADLTPPTITLTAPNGGQAWTGNTLHGITWTAADNMAVVAVDLYYRESEPGPWQPLARALANGGSFAWYVQDTPTLAARVKAVAWDAAGNSKADSSDALFAIVAIPGGAVPTTLHDFKQPGSQPLGAGVFQDNTSCASCHGGYDPTVEPDYNFRGTMMAQAARDPLFYACVTVAEQDAPASGDLCIRCHSPFGWLSGRSTPTDGSQLTLGDRDGVACDFCHRSVDAIYKPGVSPVEDQTVLGALLPAHVPTGYMNGQYVVDANTRKRGPYANPVTPHLFLQSPFHLTGDFCGVCHEVSNPVFNRVAGADYAPGPLDAAATFFASDSLLPLERTYSEWKHSAFPSGVYAPAFAGNRPDGTVYTCQDCHMPAVNGRGCNDPAAPTRPDLPLHDLTGGNSWMPPLIATLYPSETDPAALGAGSSRAVSMLQRAATLEVTTQWQVDHFVAQVTVTNHAGHKLPTGYPEGRRAWIHLVAKDEGGAVVYESGHYDPTTGVLTEDEDATVYEAKLGLSPGLAAALGKPAGDSFHFALNDTLYKDNRIPPAGFANAVFAEFGGAPVDGSRPAPRYADGQNWDVALYELPASARTVEVQLYYQTTSREYVDFLLAENTTNTTGQTLHDLWAANGRAAPVLLGEQTLAVSLVDVPGGGPARALALVPLTNPFRGALELELSLPGPARVGLDVFDVRGRQVASREYGMLGGGVHRVAWDGRSTSSRDAGVGIFFVRVRADQKTVIRRVVKQG